MAKRARPALSPQAKLLKAAFAHAAQKGWRGLDVAAIAQEAGLSVAEGYKVAPDRATLLDAYAEDIDAQIADALLKEPGEGDWHDQIFDALMLRFDAMLKDRDALRVIYYDDRRDPLAIARGARRTQRSLQRLFQLTGYAEDELGARLGATLFVPFYARLYRVWLGDEADQAKTMAALDKALERFEQVSLRLSRPLRGRARPAAEEEPEDEAADIPAPPNGSVH
jgi:AcrR family transcriptional regulator